MLFLYTFQFDVDCTGHYQLYGFTVVSAPTLLFRGYGVRSRRTRLLEDQLGRADAGSWQIADGGATRKAAAGGTSVGDYRVRFVVVGYHDTRTSPAGELHIPDIEMF